MLRPVNRPVKPGDRCMVVDPPENYGKQVTCLRAFTERPPWSIADWVCRVEEPVYCYLTVSAIAAVPVHVPAGSIVHFGARQLIPLDDFEPKELTDEVHEALIIEVFGSRP